MPCVPLGPKLIRRQAYITHDRSWKIYFCMVDKLQILTKKALKKDGVHRQGRRIKQVLRAQHRVEKLKQGKAKTAAAQEFKLLQRFRFFQEWLEKVDPKFENRTYDTDTVQKMIWAYIHRNAEELEALKKSRRTGRPPTARQSQIELHMEQEKAECISGFRVPDLSNENTVKAFRSWQGSMDNINIMRITHVIVSTV